MDQDLKKHLNHLLARSAATLALLLAALVFLALTLAFFWAQAAAAFLFFLLFIASVLVFALLGRLARREGRRRLPEPVLLWARQPLSFEELDVALRQKIGDGVPQQFHNSVLLYDLHGDMEARIILYKTPGFDKKEFDDLRRQIEQQAGETTPGAWRLHLVCVSRVDEPLLRQVADNALHGLTRAGGALTIAVCHDQVSLPPLYGSCDVRDVLRYKKLIAWLENNLL